MTFKNQISTGILLATLLAPPSAVLITELSKTTATHVYEANSAAAVTIRVEYDKVIYDKDGKEIGMIPAYEADGSGTVIREDGVILTANHVVSIEAGYKMIIKVYLQDGTIRTAKIVKTYPQDMAVLKINKQKSDTVFHISGLASIDTVDIGEDIFVIGFPFGEVQRSLSTGVVSQVNRQDSMFVTDAAVNHGNSGGGAYDSRGRIVGVVDAMLTGNADQNSGVGLCLGVDDIIKDLKEGKI